MRSNRWCLLGALAALVIGCSNPDQFAIRVTWSQGPLQQCPVTEDGATSCQAIAQSCDAKARLRIVDAVDDTVVYFTSCYDIPAATDACGLREITIPADVRIPNTMVRVQLVVWSADQIADFDLPAGVACPQSANFDALGFPQTNLDLVPPLPLPALGREVYFPVGDREVAVIELGCPNAGQLDTLACRTRNINVEASVLVPSNLRSVTAEEATSLSVKLGTPVDRGGMVRLLETELTTLTSSGTSEPRWSAVVPGPVDGVRCLQVFEVTSQATPTATCQVAAVLPSGALPMIGYRVDRDDVTKLIALANQSAGGKGFPITGLVLGVVVDRGNLPMAGVVVAPTLGTVRYPTADLSGFVVGGTSSSGMFISLDAPITTTWRATASTLAADDGSARGGVIADHVSIVVIHMNPI
jgi:hypothetical protein